MTGVDAEIKSDGASEVISATRISLDADDPTAPCLTIRMWVIGTSVTLLGCSLKTLCTLCFPSISLTQSVVQFLAFPIGKTWEKVVRDWTLSNFGWKLRLNPGPFNQKVPQVIVFSKLELISIYRRTSSSTSWLILAS